jgi:hypothetical protein
MLIYNCEYYFQAGYLYLIDLVTEQIVHEVQFEEHISNISVLQNITQACTCVLVSLYLRQLNIYSVLC